MGWKYKSIGSDAVKSSDATLNELGTEDWELVGVVGDRLLFKRDDGLVLEKERGQGMGQGGGRQGDGGASTCVCPNCGATIPHQRGVPCVNIKCPECGTTMIGKEEADGEKYPEQEDKFVTLTKEDRSTLEGHLATLEGTAASIRELLKKAGCARDGDEEKEEDDPLASIHACMTCDDFVPERVDEEKGQVGGTCDYKGWSTNGRSDCPDWVLKGTPKDEKDRIRAELEDADDGKSGQE